jgi:hypothetical protein
MGFTAERGGRGVCAADRSQPEQSMSYMSRIYPSSIVLRACYLSK